MVDFKGEYTEFGMLYLPEILIPWTASDNVLSVSAPPPAGLVSSSGVLAA